MKITIPDYKRAMSIALSVLALAIFAVILSGGNAWGLICTYWTVVTVRNVADAMDAKEGKG